MRAYDFDGLKSIPLPSGCVCDDYHVPHFHWDGSIKEKPRIIESTDPEWTYNWEYRK
jgi:hypothetical protein